MREELNPTFYQCKHFRIYELVDPITHSRFGERSWMFFHPPALKMIDGIWEFFNDYRGIKTTVIINDWYWGGRFQWRGLRTPDCTIGGNLSQHRLASAFDQDIEGVPAEEARKIILANQNHRFLKLINCIEADVNWLHADTRNVKDRISIVYP